MGKGDLALNIASHAALSNKLSVAYFSMALTAEQLTRRLVSSVSSINDNALFRGQLDDEQWAKTSASVGLLVESPLYIDDSVLTTAGELRRKCIELNSNHSLDLIIIDSIQHLNQSTEKAFISIPKQLKNLARELDIPIVITPSVPMEIEKRACKRPVLSDLSEFKELEELSDTVLFIYRDEIYNENTDNHGEAELIVAKETFSNLGRVDLL